MKKTCLALLLVTLLSSEITAEKILTEFPPGLKVEGVRGNNFGQLSNNNSSGYHPAFVHISSEGRSRANYIANKF